MSSRPEPVKVQLLREWGLPDPGDSKKSRGEVVVIGGSRRSPGAAVLAAEAALRVGAGRLGMLVPASVQASIAATMLEGAVFALPAYESEPMEAVVRSEIESADAVLFGPGFDDADQTRATLLTVVQTKIRCLVLDAFALGILAEVPRTKLPDALILNPNQEEAGILLGRALGDDRVGDLEEIARRFDAVVNCYGVVVTPEGGAWEVSKGGPGLGSSGSGDVLAGAITGFAARGLDPARAAVWGSWAHAQAGDTLTDRVGIGFLARELPAELTAAVRKALG